MPEREKRVVRSAELSPSFALPVFGALSVGKIGVGTSAPHPYKWMFSGQLSTGEDTLYYQKMHWLWESNLLVPQADVGLVHLAVAVRPASVPFSIELAMSGKVRGLFRRANLENQARRELTVVTPQLLAEQLKLGADDLIADIELKNRRLRPGKSFTEILLIYNTEGNRKLMLLSLCPVLWHRQQWFLIRTRITLLLYLILLLRLQWFLI